MGEKYGHKNESGEYHCLYGPAVECADGSKHWFVNGERHRTDGPAIEHLDGRKEWWVNNRRHRLDGPAIELPDGTKYWYMNDNLHRLDGPAIEYGGWDVGNGEWYVNGRHISPGGNEVEAPTTEEEKIALINKVKFIEVNRWDNVYEIANQWLKRDKEFYNKYKLLFEE